MFKLAGSFLSFSVRLSNKVKSVPEKTIGFVAVVLEGNRFTVLVLP
jgi:hypothetical protein